MRVVFAAAEAAPYCRTGGLGDVAGSLPKAIADTNQADISVFLPLHRVARRTLDTAGRTLADTQCNVAVPLCGRTQVGRIRELVGADVPTFFIDAPRYFDREGLYGHGDDALRYAFFSRAVVVGAPKLLGPIDVVHAHDWMTALAPIYLRERSDASTRSVFTIHNLAFQGVFSKDLLESMDLDWSLFRVDGLEFWDQLNLMKGAIAAADAVTTVSPTYAREILTPAFGQQLDGHLRQHASRLRGIVNGLDTDVWNPATDPTLPTRFDRAHPAGKTDCRRALLAHFGLVDGGGPVAGVVSRFTDQKGLDLIADAVPWMAERGLRLVVLGTGDASLEGRFQELAARHPQTLGVEIAFDDALARLIVAGSDVLLVPSRFEPCGLTQLQGMRYGTVPVVHATGGLRDTVHDPGDAALRAGRGTGFAFQHPSADGLRDALGRAQSLFETPDLWAAIVDRAFTRDSGWGPSALRYVDLYRDL